jgi:hypothetical protein
MSRQIFFFDDQDLLSRHGLSLTAGPAEKLGPVTWADHPPATDRRSAFCGSVVPWQGGYRLYYSEIGEYPYATENYRLAVAESPDGLTWTPIPVGEDGFLHPAGLPTDSGLVQPQVMLLPDGRWRMYCWWHGHSQHRVPFLAADSADGLNWEFVNLDDPPLLHPSDLNVGQSRWAAGLTQSLPYEGTEGERTLDWLEAKRRRTNDAVYAYYRPEAGRFEIYSVWLAPNDEGSGHFTPHDNAPQIRRVLQRRVSVDGLHWSDPELIVIPDEHDPPGLQFYHLAVQPVGDWQIGLLGYYHCWDQTMDLEMCFSRDGRHWQRPLRGPCLPRGTVADYDYFAIYPTNCLLDRGDHWLLLYDGINYKHNRQLPEGVTERIDMLMAARWPKGRLAGLTTTGPTWGSLEFKCIPGAEAITVNADIQGELKAELRDIYGRALAGYRLQDCVPATGDSSAHVLRWAEGQTTEAYRYDAVRLYLSVHEGVVYGVDV